MNTHLSKSQRELRKSPKNHSWRKADIYISLVKSDTKSPDSKKGKIASKKPAPKPEIIEEKEEDEFANFLQENLHAEFQAYREACKPLISKDNNISQKA